MKTDFLDAHSRHWEDAQILFQNQRWANADHLFGMAAECGLKRLMQTFGMPYDAGTDRPQERDDREHINKIWNRFESYRSGHARGATYVLPASNLFNNWHVAQRYAHQSAFNEAYVTKHKKGAETVKELVQQARRDGLI